MFYQEYNKGSFSRAVLWSVIAVCHLCAVLLPGCTVFKKEKKENAFRVKLGEVELNKGPVVGPPERLPDEPPAPPAPPLPPDEPDTPTPEPPAPAPEPPTPEPAPAPREPVIPRPKPKPKPKPKTKPKAKPKAKPKPKPKTKPKAKPAAKPKTKPKTKPKAKPKDDGVYKPDTPQSAIGTGYNRQTNARIPTGSRNAAQSYGKKFDNRTPGGGATQSMEKYGKNLVRYLKSRWTYPPKSLLGGKMPAVLIELDVAADGRVLGKKIVKRSGVNAMDQSIELMLDQLDRIPAPPDGRITQQILMQMTDD